MTPTASITYSDQEERAVLFFRRVKKDLGIPSTQKMVTLVSRVLAHLLKVMPLAQASVLINKLPDIFKMLLLKDWKYSVVDPRAYDHLDELVDRLYEEDRNHPHSLFASEVEALNMVIVILSRLDKYLNFFSFKALNDSCVEELRQIPLEDAA
jgi:uncharacterized protein (DUF2267 family)